MRISTKGRYAVEALTDLVLNHGTDFDSIREIAERRHISENYLEQIFLLLRKAGIVESVRGAQGGYRIAKEPDEISISDIVYAVEGDFSPVPCLSAEVKEETCDREKVCVTRSVWKRLMDEMESCLDSVNLASLVECIHTEENRLIDQYMI
jgi:Rrf2 family cysteine metabolism transcriptional repressor